MEKAKKNQTDVDFKNVLSLIVDFIFAFIVVSAFNLLVVLVFDLSPQGLLERGIETALYERKMGVYDFVSFGYLAAIIAYLAYFRKYFSLGDILLKNKK